MSDIQPADPRARRLALLIVAVAAAAGFLLIGSAGSLQPDLEAWIAEEPRGRLRLLMLAAILATSAPLLGFAAYFWGLGQRILRAQRYPPPGMTVVRDTPVVTGEAARRRGRIVRALAAAFAVIAVLLAGLLWQLTSLVPV